MNKYWLLLTHVDGHNIMLAWVAIIISRIVAVDHCCTNHCESQVVMTSPEDSGDKKIEMLTKCQIRSPAHRLRISFAHNDTCQVYVTDFTITSGVQHDVPRAAGNALASIRALDPAINEP